MTPPADVRGDSEGGMFWLFFADALPQNYGAVMAATDKERFNRFFHRHAGRRRGTLAPRAATECRILSAAHSAEDVAATVAAAAALAGLTGEPAPLPAPRPARLRRARVGSTAAGRAASAGDDRMP